MAKIPFLHSRKRVNGIVSWHWQPSPRLRKAGWTNRHLGDGEGKYPPAAILAAAIELNRQVDQWDIGSAAVPDTRPPPRKWTFGDLVDAYRQSETFRVEIVDSTRREYNSRIRQLLNWADDGRAPIQLINGDMVRDLRKELLAEGGSRFKCAAMLRVLRLLMRWAVSEGLLKHDPTHGVPIPTPPSRANKLPWDAVEAATSRFRARMNPLGARALRLGFWTMQRREDLRLLSRFQWRELHGGDPRDLATMANAKGQVMGFRLQQSKTGRWVDCPIPPFLHAEIERAFETSQWLFPHPQDAKRPISGDVIRRRAKPLLDVAGFKDIQLRDMRRSGMSWMKDMGALASDVFAVSGHSLLGNRKTMADVYMPPDTRAAIAAIAAASRTMAAIKEREKSR